MNQEIKLRDITVDKTIGLNTEQVEQMRLLFGKNELTPPKRTPWWKELLEKFDDPTIRILLAAAIISLIITAIEIYILGNKDANFIDSAGIFFAVFLATLVSFFSERKSAREFELLNKVKEDITIKVLRNGQISEVSIKELVVGDLVRLDAGDKLPADGILLETMNLMLDQSMMTGESVPVRKTICSLPLDIDIIHQKITSNDTSFCARGTMVVDGNGQFLVTSVGDNTEMGKIAKALSHEENDQVETPLMGKLSILAQQISVLGVVGALVIFTMMSFMAMLKSPLLLPLYHNTPIFSAILLTAIGLGFLLMQYVLKPFFAGMNMEMRSKRLSCLTALPVAIAVFVLLMGLWGIFFVSNDATESEVGIELLKSVLLAFVVAVTIIVVAVPEGLPMMVTTSLALNMMKMARENCLVRKLVASETIGSATIICTDKTGTLTQNKMQPIWFFLNQKEYNLSDISQFRESEIWSHLVQGITVNSEANLHIEHKDDPAKRVIQGIGNPTECALLKFLEENGVDYRKEREQYQRVFEVGHNSDRKMSLVVIEDNGSKICLAKGAPERLIARCGFIWIKDHPEPIAAYQTEIQEALTRASEQALRIIAFCEKPLKQDVCEACRSGQFNACVECGDQILIGLVGIADPIRTEVPQAVETCQTAGVQVKMITGDALPTAVAIAKQAGIYHSKAEELVLDSTQFNQITEEELPDAARRIRVLARSTPMDKLRLVKALHQTGDVVAMTGDGTNDAPALKYADVGLSMGITGTEVAKEASDIVLVDDNFKSIVTGIWWGRTLFQNIQRFLQFQLSVNVVALVCALIGPLVGIPLPLTVTQLLWINIIMDTFAALALSTDPPRPHTMLEKPIPRNSHIITGTMGITILVVSLYQVAILFATIFFGWFVTAANHYDFTVPITSPEYLKENLEALTVFFTVLIMFQFWHKINCRALRYNESPFTLITKNHLFLAIIITITVVQIIMVQMPFFGAFFRTTPLYLNQWIGIGLLTLTVMPVAWFGRELAHWIGCRE